MTRDQELVQQLQRRLEKWNSEGWCNLHFLQSCVYNNQGRLIQLHLCDLELSEVPSEVWQFSSLQWLYLSSNQLSSLRPELGQFTALTRLDLRNNRLSALPAELGRLSALQELNLSRNHLSTLPAELGRLSALQELDLSHNHLSTLPAELGRPSALQQLDLSDNLFHALPDELGNLKALELLNLDGNSLQTLSPEIIAQGTPAILGHLRALQQETAERFEAKVILVGEGGMGKTSLLSALQRQPFMEGRPPTNGIEVGTLLVPHPTRYGAEITLYTWDFGGQEIYQATHQFFLTHRSVYLLVWNPRLGAEACRLTFWLDTITSHAPDAKILLVATHNDIWDHPAIHLPAYQQSYPQIMGLCTLSNKTGQGQDELKAQIAKAAEKTPFVGEKWPKTWVEAEKALLACPEHHIDPATFLEVCTQHKINDEAERERFGRYLHDLGKILYFQDDLVLRTLIVLKPNWISKAISLVLTNPQVQEADGILEHQELARIWARDEQGKPYRHELYPIFVRMMERFQLSYQLEPALPGQPISQSLIPQLLPVRPPPALPPIPTVPQAGQELLELRYMLSFVPAGLMSWFLVRTHRFSLHQHWREGARLAYDDQQAQVELDAQKRAIVIKVWGPFPPNFLLILKQTLDALLQTFQGLLIQRMIPCRCYKQYSNPHYHLYEDLEQRLAGGKSQIECREGESLDLTTLLFGLHASTLSQVVATVQQEKNVILGSYYQMSPDALQHSINNVEQQLELILQHHLRDWNVEQQKLNNLCPRLFVLKRASQKPLNLHDWVSRAYRLRLLCEYPQGPHLIKGEPAYEVRQGKEWWNGMSPWLRWMVRLLEIGLPLGKSANEALNLVDIKRFEPNMKVFKEILDDLPEIKAIDEMKDARIAAGSEAQVFQQVDGAILRVMYHYLDMLDRSHWWHGLSPVQTPTGFILWVCAQHRKEFEAGPITVVEQLFGE